MEFGFSRFLEMFEERFGRTVTTAILGLVGAAVGLYCLKVIIEAASYLYEVLSKLDLLAALRQESITAHIIIFGAQIVLTSIVLQWIWNRLYDRYLASTDARVRDLLEKVQAKTAEFEHQVQDFENRRDDLKDKMDELKVRQEEIRAKMAKP